jgi:hypothetical protein
MGATIERLNLFKICGSFCLSSWLAFIMYSPCWCMADILCVITFSAFSFCRFEAWASHHNHTIYKFCLCWYWSVISKYHHLGNDFWGYRFLLLLFLLGTCQIFLWFLTCMNTISVHGILQSSHLLTIRVYPLSFSTFPYLMHRLCLNVSANIFIAHFFLF